MKDLEIMIQNLLLSIFETVTTVEQGIEILDVFMHFENHEVNRILCHTINPFN